MIDDKNPDSGLSPDPDISPDLQVSAASDIAAESAAEAARPLTHTPLHEMHLRLGARMVPFAGHAMPVQYRDGILAEHLHVRAAAGLFDVSHMGQAFLIGPDHAAVAAALEALVPADILNLAPGRQRYTQLLGEDGGILDDLMVTRPADEEEDGVLMLVVNAARKSEDFAHISARLPSSIRLMPAPHRGLIALQGPLAAAVIGRHVPGIADLPFMGARTVRFSGIECHVTRSGYTGEDGFEISVNTRRIGAIAERLTDAPEVKAIGLGARDSLRLEAGLCLYGHDIDETTSPVEAGLAWSIQKRRRGEGGFPGAGRIMKELAEGPSRQRVGLRLAGKAPAREGAVIRASDGSEIGRVTSGGYSPSLEAPVAMGYVSRRFAEPGSPVILVVRERELAATVAPLPFVPHRYHR